MSVSPEAAGVTGGVDPRRWLSLFVLLTSAFMNLIDVTIVNVALPSLERDLGATSSQIEWIVAGYVLPFALGLLPFGRLGDVVGRKTMFLIGVAGFTLMSGVCGLAPSIEWLVAARVLQGVAGAAMAPQVLAIVQNIFPAHERGSAFAMFGLSASLASVAGPILGGSLITFNLFGLEWRPIFLINLPIGIAALVAAWRLLPALPGQRGLAIDRVGVGLASASVFLLVFPLVEGRSFGWPLWVFAMMASSLAGFALFIAWLGRQDRKGAAQLLPFSLLRNRNYVVGSLATMVFFSGVPGFFMIFAMFLQSGFGLSPIQSGLTTTPFPIGIFLASLIASRMGPKFLLQRLVIGALVMAAGMVWLRLDIVATVDAASQLTYAPALFVAGFGMGIAFAVLFQAVLSGVPGKDAGAGSGGLQAIQQMGGALGIALIGELFFPILSAHGRPDHASFVAAASNALIYTIAAFVLVAVLALLLVPARRPPQLAAPGPTQPQAAE